MTHNAPKFKVGDIIKDKNYSPSKRTIAGIDPPGKARDGDLYRTPSYSIGPFHSGSRWRNLPLDYVEENYELDEESMVDRILTKYSNA